MRKVLLLTTVLLITKITTTLAQTESSWKYGVNDFIGIEIEYGPESIRLLKEGLVCHKSPVSKHDKRKLGKTGIRFFNLWDLDFSKLEKIESYLSTCDFFTKDTIVDYPGLVVSDFPELNITVINREKVYRIHFVDGYSEEIKTCIKLLNDLVPQNKKEFRLCVFMTECHSD